MDRQMNTRRNFFKRFAAVAAVIAMAPQIAFRRKVAREWEIAQFWYQERCVVRCYSEDYLKAIGRISDCKANVLTPEEIHRVFFPTDEAWPAHQTTAS